MCFENGTSCLIVLWWPSSSMLILVDLNRASVASSFPSGIHFNSPRGTVLPKSFVCFIIFTSNCCAYLSDSICRTFFSFCIRSSRCSYSSSSSSSPSSFVTLIILEVPFCSTTTVSSLIGGLNLSCLGIVKFLVTFTQTKSCLGLYAIPLGIVRSFSRKSCSNFLLVRGTDLNDVNQPFYLLKSFFDLIELRSRLFQYRNEFSMMPCW